MRPPPAIPHGELYFVTVLAVSYFPLEESLNAPVRKPPDTDPWPKKIISLPLRWAAVESERKVRRSCRELSSTVCSTKNKLPLMKPTGKCFDTFEMKIRYGVIGKVSSGCWGETADGTSADTLRINLWQPD